MKIILSILIAATIATSVLYSMTYYMKSAFNDENANWRIAQRIWLAYGSQPSAQFVADVSNVTSQYYTEQFPHLKEASARAYRRNYLLLGF